MAIPSVVEGEPRNAEVEITLSSSPSGERIEGFYAGTAPPPLLFESIGQCVIHFSNDA